MNSQTKLSNPTIDIDIIITHNVGAFRWYTVVQPAQYYC